ncbi:MAG TPA: TetR/AcrR family transcriptional regulator [Solirubrobacteraceae bacterium]|nr:TetR/AcrR family transcriptional regulator [Solirubrobacteraceae bacterium]
MAAVANHGYVDATVADVVDLAGVSRTTFYAHFKSKEECFLATHDLIVELGTERVSSAYRSAESARDRLRAGFDAFVDVVTSDPAATQLVIIEALAAGREAVAHWERAAASFERMFRQSFDEARAAGPVSDITICAIVGGIRRVVYLHLRERRIDELPALVDDLLDWALSYQAPAVRPPARPRAPAAAEDLRAVSTAAAPPPDLAHARALYTQRERILRAVAALVAERGYAKLTIPHISATAGTSNQTLYENFSGKEEALLATFDDFAVRALAETGAAFNSMPTWPDALREALRTLLAFIASEPAFARLAFFELMTAGSAAQQRSELVLDAFAGFLQPGFERSPDVPPVVAHAIAGGIWSVVHNEIAHDRLAQLPALTPSVAYLALAPFLGASDAAEVARKRRRGGRRTRRSA